MCFPVTIPGRLCFGKNGIFISPLNEDNNVMLEKSEIIHTIDDTKSANVTIVMMLDYFTHTAKYPGILDVDCGETTITLQLKNDDTLIAKLGNFTMRYSLGLPASIQ